MQFCHRQLSYPRVSNSSDQNYRNTLQSSYLRFSTKPWIRMAMTMRMMMVISELEENDGEMMMGDGGCEEMMVVILVFETVDGSAAILD